MKIINEQTTPAQVIDTMELDAAQLRALSHPLAYKVMQVLHEHPQPILKIANQLRVHEQTLYYVIHKLVAAKLLVAQLDSQGRKLYAPSSPSYFVRIGQMSEGVGLKQAQSNFLYPFVENKTLSARIIVGSPDPHGPHLARSKDGYFGMDLAVFLGTFVTTFPGSVVKLDTESKPEDLSQNLILIGGPIVNQVSSKLNDYAKGDSAKGDRDVSKAPVYFDAAKRAFVVKSKKKTFIDEDIGIICKQRSPFAKDAFVLYVAGIRNYGTRAAIQAMIKHFSEFESYSKTHEEFCAVVRGEDLDSDGVVDNASIIGFY